MYIRKTKDIWNIEANYGNGWETECSYDTYAEARRDIKEYRASYAIATYRIVKRRVKI